MFRILLAGLLAVLVALAGARSQEKEKTKPAAGKSATKIKADAVPGYKIKEIEGFTVLLSKESLEMHGASKDDRKPLEVLEQELKTITRIMPPKALKVLRNVSIWVEWDHHLAVANGGEAVAVYYGGHQLALLAKGLNPLTSSWRASGEKAKTRARPSPARKATQN